jgi:pyruvate kinase
MKPTLDPTKTTPASTADLVAALSELRASATGNEQRFAAQIGEVHPVYRASARNFVHYLSLRQHDLRGLQRALAARGLSSLGRCESHTLTAIDAVLHALGFGPRRPAEHPVDFESGPARLEDHTRRLLGPRPAERATHIMVTMPPEAAMDAELVGRLLTAGMDIMRINCAHDDARAWRAMVRHLRAGEKRTGRSCRVLVDLAGPKLRTGRLAVEPGVVRLKVKHDRHGATRAPARVWLTPAHAPEPAPDGVEHVLPVRGLPRGWNGIREVRIQDARRRHRKLEPVQSRGRSLLCHACRTTYVEEGARLAFVFGHKRATRRGRVDRLPTVPVDIRLQAGDRLVLTRAQTPGRPAARGELPARIPCTLPEVFRDVRAGEPIWIDDGKIGGKVLGNDRRSIEVAVEQVPPGGARLLPDKGINLPETELHLPALSRKDLADLAFARKCADMIGLSFAQRPEDVIDLQGRLARGRRPAPGIVLKIETRRGFEALPALLLAGLRSPPLGVMVARGDLAVEVGFERLAEVQEEILWLSEAAHVPVIWATQVLETLAKKGAPSRAEVTDAAMGVRAECVMLNKGPYVDRAVAFLANVLARMQEHQDKKRSTLRRLRVAGRGETRALPQGRRPWASSWGRTAAASPTMVITSWPEQGLTASRTAGRVVSARRPG